MPELVATGRNPGDTWRFTLPEHETICLGRAPRHGWQIPWDAMISREHAQLTWDNDQLRVRCLETARNPIYFNGQPQREFTIPVGGEFRIGMTDFKLINQVTVVFPVGVLQERTYSTDDLRRFEFKDADRRLEALARLPGLITESRSDEDFATRLVGLLLQAIPRSDIVAVLRYDAAIPSESSDPSMLRFEGREDDTSRFRPSRRLVRSALERRESVLHVSSNADEADSRFTMQLGHDWAYVTPILSEACKGWCLYATGKFGGRVGQNSVQTVEELHGDLRFTELMAQFIGAIRQVRMFERREAGIAQFFSPSVMEMLTRTSGDALRPRETDITVLFCDLRGFSKKAEQGKQDLGGLLERVSAALGAMTRSIIRHDGVIADFQGDAVLGFWGWPLPPSDGPLPACRAALDIAKAFALGQDNPHDPLHGFRIGIGIAHGRAIAGRIGTEEQSKVGVFGSVVNLGSRLEGMTKQLRVPVLIDEVTADYVRKHLSSVEGRCRRLGRVRPYGMTTPVAVSELLLPYGGGSLLTDEQLALYERAIDALAAGQWHETLDLLERPGTKDLAKDFLRIFIAQNDYDPPRDWDGVISMSTK